MAARAKEPIIRPSGRVLLLDEDDRALMFLTRTGVGV